eukprot:11165640-Lingulodinium_polyedra.AAC.1
MSGQSVVRQKLLKYVALAGTGRTERCPMACLTNAVATPCSRARWGDLWHGNAAGGNDPQCV